MQILVIGELVDYTTSIKRHFSLTKGFEIAIGFSEISEISKTYYLTMGKTCKYKSTNLILQNINEINGEFLKSMYAIILIREHNILDVMNANSSLEKLFLDKLFLDKHDKRIIMKSDSISWLNNKIYRKEFPYKYNIKFIDFVCNCFDTMCCQTQELVDIGLNEVKRYYPAYLSIIKSKLFISRMGIPNHIPLNPEIENPYCPNHSYCTHSAINITECDKYTALLPLCYSSYNYKFNSLEKFNKPKIKMIYMGRIKIDDGKILYLMNQIMKKLGDDYELHIFPGRFVLPGCNIKVFSPKFPKNIQLIRDAMFYDCNNVIVHMPFDDIDKTKYLQWIDIAIDFSQSRPYNKKSPQGNAKLLEYCYYGLKVVTEKNVNNSHLVLDGKNGILLDGIGTVDDYVDAIKKLSIHNKVMNNMDCIDITIKSNSWKQIAQEMYDSEINK